MNYPVDTNLPADDDDITPEGEQDASGSGMPPADQDDAQTSPEVRRWLSRHGNELQAGRIAQARATELEARNRELYDIALRSQNTPSPQGTRDGLYETLEPNVKREWDALLKSTPLDQHPVVQKLVNEVNQGRQWMQQVGNYIQQQAETGLRNEFAGLEKEFGTALTEDMKSTIETAYRTGGVEQGRRITNLLRQTVMGETHANTQRRRSASGEPGGRRGGAPTFSALREVDGKKVYDSKKSWEQAEKMIEHMNRRR